MNENCKILTGNEACTLGAIAAGMRFFAGYPITPATEIAEISSELLPKCGGRYIQMEDELASIAAVIGASFTGTKSMTATSGPGFSLMQENLGYGIVAEVPCVIVNVMRQGPCQGGPTLPAQGDIMQTRWGTHGDHPMITIAPASVREMYFETVRAFNLAEKYRTPVIVLSDAMLAHMSEKVILPAEGELEIVNRKKPECAPEEYTKPYALEHDADVPPMASFGDGYRWYVSGLIHDETGFPRTNDAKAISGEIRHLMAKVNANIEDIQRWEEYKTEDAEMLITGIGLTARSAKGAIDLLRAEGYKVGLFRPITLWPFPEKRLNELAGQVEFILTCEMNEGQLCGTVKEAAEGKARCISLTQNTGRLIEASTIVKAVKEACAK